LKGFITGFFIFNFFHELVFHGPLITHGKAVVSIFLYHSRRPVLPTLALLPALMTKITENMIVRTEARSFVTIVSGMGKTSEKVASLRTHGE
jgi:hypothetical protein